MSETKVKHKDTVFASVFDLSEQLMKKRPTPSEQRGHAELRDYLERMEKYREKLPKSRPPRGLMQREGDQASCDQKVQFLRRRKK